MHHLHDFLWTRRRFSGRWEVFVQPLPNLETRWQVSTEGGVSPIWNPAGGELFYRRGNAMMRVPIAASGQSLKYGNSETMFEGSYVPEDDDSIRNRSYAVAPGGQRFLMMREQEPLHHDAGAAQLVVIRNWGAELERRMPPR